MLSVLQTSKEVFHVSSFLIPSSQLSRFQEPHVHGVIRHGCVASPDSIKIEAYTVAVTDGIALHDLDGASTFCGCIRPQALRTGPMTFGSAGLPELVDAVGKPLFVA